MSLKVVDPSDVVGSDARVREFQRMQKKDTSLHTPFSPSLDPVAYSWLLYCHLHFLFLLWGSFWRFFCRSHTTGLLWGSFWSFFFRSHTTGLLWTSVSSSQRPLPDNATLTRDKHPWPRWYSNPHSQEASGRRPTYALDRVATGIGVFLYCFMLTSKLLLF